MYDVSSGMLDYLSVWARLSGNPAGFRSNTAFSKLVATEIMVIIMLMLAF